MTVAVFLVLALVCAGAVSAAVGSGAEEPTESTVSIETTVPADAPEATETTLPTEGTESETTLSDPDTDPSVEAGPFGQMISALRHEGDHTPAAVIMGKDVPGWNPEKHSAATTTTTVLAPADAATDDASENDGDTELQIRSAGGSDKSGQKPSKATARLKGKKGSGHSK